jgi:hypothetical protein
MKRTKVGGARVKLTKAGAWVKTASGTYGFFSDPKTALEFVKRVCKLQPAVVVPRV